MLIKHETLNNNIQLTTYCIYYGTKNITLLYSDQYVIIGLQITTEKICNITTIPTQTMISLILTTILTHSCWWKTWVIHNTPPPYNSSDTLEWSINDDWSLIIVIHHHSACDIDPIITPHPTPHTMWCSRKTRHCTIFTEMKSISFHIHTFYTESYPSTVYPYLSIKNWMY